MTRTIDLPPPTARDAQVRAALLPLIEACAWREAAAIIRARLDETAFAERRHIDALFGEWLDIPSDLRPPFFEWAHARRRPSVESGSR